MRTKNLNSSSQRISEQTQSLISRTKSSIIDLIIERSQIYHSKHPNQDKKRGKVLQQQQQKLSKTDYSTH